MSSANEILEDRRRELKNLDERAKYYFFERGDHKQALSNYIEALNALGLYRVFYDAAIRSERADRGELPYEIVYSDENKVLFTTNIGIRLFQISECKTGDDEIDASIEAYTTEKIKIICKELAKYQKIFDGLTIGNFEYLSFHVESREKSVLENQSLLKKGGNEYIKALKKALSSACKDNICLVKLEKSSSSGCFIATAAYSTSIHPDLDTFRSFRDEKLLPHPLGAKLISLYYKISPTLATYITQQPTIKKLLKHHLSRLANWMRTQKISNDS